MNVADYWLMAREYSIWTAAIASLQFWTADLDTTTLNTAIEEVFSAFFYAPSAYTLCQQPDKILFGCFMTTLNTAFEQILAIEGDGYESSSENFNMPPPLRKMLKIHHISGIEHASFNSNLVTPCSTF